MYIVMVKCLLDDVLVALTETRAKAEEIALKERELLLKTAQEITADYPLSEICDDYTRIIEMKVTE